MLEGCNENCPDPGICHGVGTCQQSDEANAARARVQAAMRELVAQQREIMDQFEAGTLPRVTRLNDTSGVGWPD